MFEREITEDRVFKTLEEGEVIAEYPEDQPYPSQLLLSFERNIPLHVVAATDEKTKYYYIITVYVPDPKLWDSDFKKRRLR